MKNITRFLNKWLAEHDFEVSTKKGDEWCYFYSKSLITYEVGEEMTEQNERFLEVCRECGLEYEVSLFTLSFFHELGHHETMDDFTDREWARDEKVKSRVENSFDYERMDYTYFHLPSEYCATEWGVDYINEHIDEIEKFDEKIKELLW